MSWLKGVERGLRWCAFRLVRGLLRVGSADRAPGDARAMGRLLIVRPEKIGDVVVTLPLVEAVRRAAPRLEIDLLVSPRAQALVAGDPRFHAVHIYVKGPRFVRTLLALRRRGFDCVLDLIDGDSVTGLLLSQLCASRDALRIAGVKESCARYYDASRSPAALAACHGIDRSLSVLGFLGLEPREAPRQVPPFVAPGEQERVEQLFGEMFGDAATVRIGYNLSAGSATRLWPPERARLLLAAILEAYPYAQVLLTTTPADWDTGARLRGQFPSRVHQVPRDLSITGAAALVGKLDLLITPDTALVHLARAFDVPVVGLYRNVHWNIERWKPYGQERGVVVSPSAESIADITTERVLAEVHALLEPASIASWPRTR